MTRWIGKRGLWGVVAGVAVAGGALATEPGDVVTFKEGTKDRKVTVTKVNKKADGSLEVTGKDAATGEVSTWIEGPTAAAPVAPMTGGKAVTPPTPPAPPAAPPTPPKAKTRTDDPIGANPAATAETPAEQQRRLFNGKLLGRDTPAPTPAAAAGTPAPQVAEAEPKGKFLNRIFGKKSAPVPAAMPGPAVTTPTPAAKAAPSAGEPRVATPARPVVTPTPAPAVKTPAPVAVPSPGIPVPMPLPATRPPVTAPPVAAPSVGAPPVSIPIPQPLPPVVPLPTIPGVPQSARPGDPVHVVLPVGFIPPEVAMNDDLRPHTTVLRDGGAAVADRLAAVRCLGEGRHGSSDRVKEMLFAAAQADASPAVRGACIDQLVRLGYYHPDFVRHVQTAAEGAAGPERDSARAAVSKLTPRRW